MNIIDKIVAVATDEIGYLEKSSNLSLNDKTANAGNKNYTKYWADVDKSYQAQPWCAAFVTWCLDKVVGKDGTKKLLKHYPFVYCPTLGKLLTHYSKPQKGDIVLFMRRGEFVHTGIVIAANGDFFTTVEGNTNSGTSIIENGGAVRKKSYNINNLPGTVFVRPDYFEFEEEAFDMNELEKYKTLNDTAIAVLKVELEALKAKTAEKMVYNYIDENMPEWARESVKWCVDNEIIKGTGSGLGLDDDKLWMCVVIHRTAKAVAKLINVKI